MALEEWHPKQRAKWEKDGSFVLEVPFSAEGELLMDILKFGPDVEVLAPSPLRNTIRERLAALAKLYA